MLYYYVNPICDMVGEIGITPELTVEEITTMLGDSKFHKLKVYTKKHLALNELYKKIEGDKVRIVAEHDERLRAISREYTPLLMADK